MQPWDDRGQSIQVGAVLIFAALILLLSLYQASVVPQQNEQVEFDHSQRVQGELLDLRNAVTSTVGDAARQSVSVGLGTSYPPRVLSMNPPPVSGQLRTVGTADGDVSFALSNVEALDDETDDFWDGRQRNYDTGAVVYRPNYNEYGQPPTTVYENSVLYDDFSFEGSTVARSEQGLIDGNAITLVALNGSLGRSSSGRTSVDVRPVSASATTVAVENASSTEPVTVRVPTRLDETAWEELLADQRVGAGGNVTDVGTTPIPGTTEFELLVVELAPGTYDLRMAKAGVGTRVTGESAAYVTEVAGNGSSVPVGGSESLTVEVRDAYNNPVPGVEVAGASADPSVGALESATATTGDDGRATFRLETESVSQTTTLPVTFSYAVDPGSAGFDADRPQNVDMTLEVQNTQVDGPSGGGGSAPYSVTWDSPSASEGGTHLAACDASDCTWDVGADADDTLDLSAVVEDAVGGVDSAAVEGATVDFSLNDSGVGILSPDVAVSGESGDVATTLSASENGTVRLYAVSGGASDVLNVTVANVTDGSSDAGPAIGLRVDDFTDRNGNDPYFVASYDVRNANSSFARVEATFEAESGNPSGTRQSGAERGGLVYQPGHGDDRVFDVRLDVIFTDDQGAEYVAASETITDTADARNPTGQNADLSESGSAALADLSVEDRSNVNANDVRYRFDYTVSSTGSFDRVKLFVLNLDSGGAAGALDETSRSGKNVDVEPDFGANAQYRVGVAVFDADGAVVEVVDVTDAADGDGVVLTATLALLGAALVGHAVRRPSMR